MNSHARLLLLRAASRTPLGDQHPPIVEESEPLQFEYPLTAPATVFLWRLRLGDLLPEKPQGTDLGEIVRWERRNWFDSCRGRVEVSLECNTDVSASYLGMNGWQVVQRASVMVRPSKITEEEWGAMLSDLDAVAVGLASDVVGRATAGLGRAIAARTPLEELEAARKVLSRLDLALSRMLQQPHTVLRTSSERTSETPRRLDSATLKRLVARGVNPRRCPTRASSRTAVNRPRPSLDVPEHRQIVGTLRAVNRTLAAGESRAKSEIAELEADRAWRERPTDPPGSSLYDRLDRPRIERLNTITMKSAALRRRSQQLADSPILAGLAPIDAIRPSLVSHYLPPYQLAWRAMVAWRAAGRVQVEMGDQLRRKDTARMYEQWVFLQLASGLRALGFRLEAAEDVFRRITRRRFMMDLPRGARLTFVASDGAKLALYFEPWVRPLSVAERIGDAFFHGRERNAAWSPDILLSFDSVPGVRPRAVVIDAKYTTRVTEDHWSGVLKYFQIRRVADRHQAVDQVWLSAPRTNGIRLEDDTIAWTEAGPDQPLGAGTVHGQVGLAPSSGRLAGDPVPLVLTFLTGILAHGQVAVPDAP